MFYTTCIIYIMFHLHHLFLALDFQGPSWLLVLCLDQFFQQLGSVPRPWRRIVSSWVTDSTDGDGWENHGKMNRFAKRTLW